MAEIFIDIETIPNQGKLANELIDVKPPATITKAETLAKWEEETRPIKEAEAKEKLALDGLSNHIVAFGYVIDDNEPECRLISDVGGEKAFLQTVLNELLAKSGEYGNIWIGHNVLNFDLNVIKKRCIILGIKPPLKIPFDAKPWDDSVYDTMLRWDAKNYTSQDKIAKALELEGKGDMGGSMVYRHWLEGRQEEIREYCRQDVVTVREIYKRMKIVL